jgi:hypothetical protein
MGFSAKQCPIVAEFLLAFRAEFGEVTLTYLSEGGFEHGAPSTGEYVQPHVEQRKKK